MTNRDFYVKVIAGDINDEVIEKAQEMLDKHDASNEKARQRNAEKAAEKAAENIPMRDAIVAQLGTEFKTAATLLAESDLDVTPQKIATLLKPMIETGAVVKGTVKVGKGKQVGYALATEAVEG